MNRRTRFCRPVRNHSATWPGFRRSSCDSGRRGGLAIQEAAQGGNAAKPCVLAEPAAIDRASSSRFHGRGFGNGLRAVAPHHGRQSGASGRRDRPPDHRGAARGAARAFRRSVEASRRLSRHRCAGGGRLRPRAAEADGVRQAVAGRRHQGDRPRARCRLRHRLFGRRAGAARRTMWWRWKRMRRSRVRRPRILAA